MTIARAMAAASFATYVSGVCALGILGIASPAGADAALLKQIPDEYESTSGHGLAMNNAGFAASDSFSAIRANPALLARDKEYTVNAGYHWPSAGRDYYQAGVVDSKTSSVAVGLTYTGYTDNYTYVRPDFNGGTASAASPFDSPVIRRGVVGVAGNMGALALGAGATYVEAHTLLGSAARLQDDTSVKGVGVNLGAAATLSPQVSVGGSVENASNPKIKDYEPQTYRVGVAYLMAPGMTAFIDGRQRDRVAEFESDLPTLGAPAPPSKLMAQPERMLIGSLSGQVQEYLRLTGSYGQSFTDPRRSLAGGIALVSKNASFSYTMARPYLAQSASHQAVTLSFEMAM